MGGEKDWRGSVPFFYDLFTLLRVSVTGEEFAMENLRYLQIFPCAFAAQVALCVDQKTRSTRQRFFKKGISRSERYSVVSAFNDKIGRGEESLHLGQSLTVMAQEVGSWERVQSREDGSGDELSCHVADWSWYKSIVTIWRL